ncbi:MAG: hypothetical protein RL033_2433 [Pseudomonadota bacterium]
MSGGHPVRSGASRVRGLHRHERLELPVPGVRHHDLFQRLPQHGSSFGQELQYGEWQRWYLQRLRHGRRGMHRDAAASANQLTNTQRRCAHASGRCARSLSPRRPARERLGSRSSRAGGHRSRMEVGDERENYNFSGCGLRLARARGLHHGLTQRLGADGQASRGRGQRRRKPDTGSATVDDTWRGARCWLGGRRARPGGRRRPSVSRRDTSCRDASCGDASRRHGLWGPRARGR